MVRDCSAPAIETRTTITIRRRTIRTTRARTTVIGRRLFNSLVPLILLLSLNVGRIPRCGAEPLLRSFTSCLSQHSSTLAPTDQAINFTQLWTQIDTGQRSPGELGNRPQPDLLRLSLLGNVASQSTGYSNQTNFLATLITETSILNFQAFFNQSSLCSSIRTPLFPSSSSDLLGSSQTSNSSLAPNSGCPYGPGDIALGVTIPLSSPYPFTTITTQLHLLDTSTPALTLACIQFQATPYYPELIYYRLLLWIPIGIALTYLIVCWTGRLWAAMISVQLNHEAQLASSISDPFNASPHWSSRFGQIWWQCWSGQGLLLSGALLRFATPSARDVITHIQFVTLLGLFSVEWPEFVYPILGRGAWSTLVLNSTLIYTKTATGRRPNPLSTLLYQPPSDFVTQFDAPDSPLYLDRGLPNSLLNMDATRNGLPSWAVIVGVQPRDLFGLCLTIFAMICCAIFGFSVIIYFIDLLVTLISRATFTNTRHQRPIRDSTLYSSGDTDDGTGFNQPGSNHPTSYNSKQLDHHWWHGITKPTKTHTREKVMTVDLTDSMPPSPVDWPRWRLHWALLQGMSKTLAIFSQYLSSYVHGAQRRIYLELHYLGNLLRIFLLFYFPIVVFSAYQMTLIHTASNITVGMAAFCLLLAFSLPIAQLQRIKSRTTEDLIDNPNTALALGPLYNTLADRNEIFMGVHLFNAFVVGVAIGAAQSSAMTQTVVLLVAELTETMLTSLWIPWGEGAAMAPLAFIFSVVRIITAVNLVVLTPTVSVGSVAAGWLSYVILALQGFVILILAGVLFVKIVELLLRLFAHIPFDETRSTRSGGLAGAFRRWDRNVSRSTRHGRAAAIAARRRRRRGSKQINPIKPTPAHGTTASGQNSMYMDKHKQSMSTASASMAASPQFGGSNDYHSHLYPGQASTAAFNTLNDDDGNIMSAMSQGPWLRASGPEAISTGYIRPGAYSNHVGSHTPKSYQNEAAPSAGFSVVRGGRASEKTPYLMHDDGRRTWQNMRPPTSSPAGMCDYPPSVHPAKLSASTHSLIPDASQTANNLFQSSLYQPSTPDFEQRVRPRTNSKASQKPDTMLRSMFGLFQSRHRKRREESSDEDDWDDSDDDGDDDDDDDDERAGNARNHQQRDRRKITGLMRGIGKWGRQKEGASLASNDATLTAPQALSDPVPTTSSKTFEVVRQPRPRPSPAGSSTSPNKNVSGPIRSPSDNQTNNAIDPLSSASVSS